MSKLKKHSIEVGAKFTSRFINNRYYVDASDNPANENFVRINERSDIFRYTQKVGAVYALAKFNLKKNSYAEAGARAEKTWVEGRFEKLSNFNNVFFNAVPTAVVSKKIKDHTVSLAFSRRLTRPYIWDLSPNVNYSDPKNLQTGNPELQPEISDQLELTHAYTGPVFINSALYWRRTGNAIIDFTTTDSVGVSTTSKFNLAANTISGANFSYNINPNANLVLNGNVNISLPRLYQQRFGNFQQGLGSRCKLKYHSKIAREIYGAIIWRIHHANKDYEK